MGTIIDHDNFAKYFFWRLFYNSVDSAHQWRPAFIVKDDNDRNSR